MIEMMLKVVVGWRERRREVGRGGFRRRTEGRKGAGIFRGVVGGRWWKNPRRKIRPKLISSSSGEEA